MSNKEQARAYFVAWNARDAEAILATLGDGGTYEDPKTGGPISGPHLKGYVEALWAAFPDLNFELASEAEAGPDSLAAEWIMRGTNHGSFAGLPPTGRAVEMRGADFITFADGHIRTVTGYFDGGAIPAQLGLDIVVQPKEVGPFRFGTSTEVRSGKRDRPGAFSITYLEALDDAAAQRVRDGSRDSMIDMLKMDGFIGATTAKIGNRMVTITAWTDADASQKVMREGKHSEVMREMYDGTLASGGVTSVWSLERDNGWMMRCSDCGKMTRKVSDGDRCKCGAELPLHPAYW